MLNLSCQNALTVIKNAQPVEDELDTSTEASEVNDSNTCEDDQSGYTSDECDDDDENNIPVVDHNSSDDEEIDEDSSTDLPPYYKVNNFRS